MGRYKQTQYSVAMLLPEPYHTSIGGNINTLVRITSEGSSVERIICNETVLQISAGVCRGVELAMPSANLVIGGAAAGVVRTCIDAVIERQTFLV